MPADVEAVGTVGAVDVLSAVDGPRILLVAVGATATLCVEAAARAAAEGVPVMVVDPQWVAPLPVDLVELARSSAAVMTVEDNTRACGVGARLSQLLRDANVDVPVRDVGLPQAFLEHGKRSDVAQSAGLSPAAIVHELTTLAIHVNLIPDSNRAPDVGAEA